LLGNRFVRFDLNEPIVQGHITTNQDSHDFAIKVALMSRKIHFEGDDDRSGSLKGTHFSVMQTPTVAQMIDDAEFRNFGQQAVLG
jgi:hypothetical protein